MGGKQSKLKKELETLRADAVKSQQQVDTLQNEKRLLEYKLQVLQEMAAKAQLEAEHATQLALESEEKMKVLKWELVRSLSVATTTSSPSPSSTTASPRVAVNWKLKEGVALRGGGARGHVQSVPEVTRAGESRPQLPERRAQSERVTKAAQPQREPLKKSNQEEKTSIHEVAVVSSSSSEDEDARAHSKAPSKQTSQPDKDTEDVKAMADSETRDEDDSKTKVKGSSGLASLFRRKSKPSTPRSASDDSDGDAKPSSTPPTKTGSRDARKDEDDAVLALSEDEEE
ncbi:hypothetical protein Poli38472_003195 [Pythium oligandrum]|uniref:Uncharacterized protein n=1 Tax=Pythium oligandrum TaxID=41045 RepID=A0A8K1FBH1_PYTOL|nr:hypothetical protein Poli38472_003195 [Pythium oligandrum]|eukprot:TMW57270.1 hypothetical protein Poli38472_003195 [Pythium oligandrum]